MFINVYSNAKDFLLKTEPILMRNETLNGLMLGICFRLRKYPERITTAPYLATVEDERGLVIAACMTPPHNIVLYSDRTNDDVALAMLIENLRENNWSVPGVLGPASVAEKFAKLWGKLSEKPYRQGLSAIAPFATSTSSFLNEATLTHILPLYIKPIHYDIMNTSIIG